MSKHTTEKTTRPMNVAVAKGSDAEKTYRAMAGLPEAIAPTNEAIAPGLHPTPLHDLIFHGGKTIRHLTYTNFYIGGAAAWKPSDINHIDQALAAAMSDQNLNNVLVQYFGNQPISSTFTPSQIINDQKPAVFSQGDVEQMIGRLKAEGKLDGFDLSATVFNLMLPSGTVLNTDSQPHHAAASAVNAAAVKNPTGATAKTAIPIEDEASSLQGLGGYHGSIHLNGQAIYYAVGAFSERQANGTDNGIVVFDAPWKNVVATFYHELCEARTDPDVEDAIKAGNSPTAGKFLGWTSRQGEEIGDFPISESNPLTQVMQEITLADGSGRVPVQFQYSNFVHGPEGPITAPHPPVHH